VRVSRDLGDGGLGARTVQTVRRVQRYTCGEKTSVGRTDVARETKRRTMGKLDDWLRSRKRPKTGLPSLLSGHHLGDRGKKAKPPGRWSRAETWHKQRGAQRIIKVHCKIIDGATGTKTCEWFISSKKNRLTPPQSFSRRRKYCHSAALSPPPRSSLTHSSCRTPKNGGSSGRTPSLDDRVARLQGAGAVGGSHHHRALRPGGPGPADQHQASFYDPGGRGSPADTHPRGVGGTPGGGVPVESLIGV